MITAISETLADDGKLLLVAHKREEAFPGPPWPLEKHEVDLFKREGLTEILHEIHKEASEVSNTRFKILYQKYLKSI